MKLPQTGGCQCGKIRYEITEAPTLVYTCHCTDCQRLTSSAFSLGIVVTETALRLSGVEPGVHSVAVELDLVEPIGPLGGLLDERGELRLYPGR